MFLAGEHIQATVRDGLVTLEGDVHQELQRMLAEAQVKRVRGICGLSNKLQIKPQAPARKEIETTHQEGAGPLNDQPWVEIGEAEAG